MRGSLVRVARGGSKKVDASGLRGLGKWMGAEMIRVGWRGGGVVEAGEVVDAVGNGVRRGVWVELEISVRWSFKGDGGG